MLRNTLNGKSCFIQRTLFELNIVTLRRLLATYIQKIKLNSRTGFLNLSSFKRSKNNQVDIFST